MDHTAQSQELDLPYQPSWIDLVSERIDRLPGSWWFYYAGLGAFIFAVQVTILWLEGGSPTGGPGFTYAYLAAAMAYMLALIHYLDRQAGAALEHPSPDAGHAVGDDHTSQAPAVLERPVPDAGHAVPKAYAGQVGAACERPPPDTGDALTDDHTVQAQAA